MAVRIETFKKELPQFLAGLAVGAVLGAIEYHNPHRRFDKQPKDIRDYLLWGVLRPVMVTLADGKVSHFWHWRKVLIPENTNGILLPGNPTEFRRVSELDKIKMSLGGWSRIHKLKPVTETGDEYRGKYKVAFKGNPESDYAEACSLILNGPIRMLQGDGDCLFFTRGINGERIKLQSEGIYSRKDKSINDPLV